MKKPVLFLSLICIVFTVTAVKAGDLTIGAAAWYSAWSPSFEDKMMGKFENPFETLPAFSGAQNSTYKMDPAIMTGLMLSYVINDKWNFSALGLMSTAEYDMKSSFNSSSTIGLETTVVYVDFAVNYNRYDIDATFNRKINDKFKFIIGMKYLSFDGKGIYNYVNTPDFTNLSVIFLNNDLKGTVIFTQTSSSLGPAIGLSYSGSLGGGFYLLINATGLIAKTNQEEIKDQVDPAKADKEEKTDFMSLGINSSASLAYYFSSINTTLAVGGRYQSLINAEATDANANTFYGFYGSVTYTFSSAAGGEE